MIKVTYRTNNSGGYWWLSDEDWQRLEDAGWDVDWVRDWKKKNPQKITTLGSMVEKDRYMGCLAVEASKTFPTFDGVIADFEIASRQSLSDEGCECCGPPHSMSAEGEKRGEYWYLTTGESRLIWE